MKIDFSDLTGHVTEDVALTEQQLLDVSAKLTLDAQRKLVERTPVDTGTARRGWHATTPTAPFQSGVVENNVDYIVDLNNGHSGQAPAGFVEQVVQSLGGAPD